MPPGQDSGHRETPPRPAGFDWAAYVDWLVESRGTLAAVADRLAAERRHTESVESIERGLRRLRQKADGDGGVWGRRVIAAFGLPEAVVDRVRWMGLYHSRFTDLPVPVALDLLRLWDRAPVRETPAGAFVSLGLASVWLRSEERARAAEALDRVGPAAPDEARLEKALVESFLRSRTDDAASAAALDRAGELLESAELEPGSRACFQARWVDQRAWRLNRGRQGPKDHAGALALYRSIPEDGPPFARCRRHNGLGWTLHKMGRTEEGRLHARLAVEEAGDAGMLRLRAMALRLLAVVGEPDEAARARERSLQIAADLEDGLLWKRFTDRR